VNGCRTLGVMPGLDPGIHDEFLQKPNFRFCFGSSLMDCRVKPGNDHLEKQSLKLKL
jgi:hypothetical protein